MTDFLSSLNMADNAVRSFLEQVVQYLSSMFRTVSGSSARRGFSEQEEVAIVGLVLLPHQLSDRLAALLRRRPVEEPAVQAAAQIGMAIRALVPAADLASEGELLLACVADLHDWLYYISLALWRQGASGIVVGWLVTKKQPVPGNGMGLLGHCRNADFTSPHGMIY